jgi:hypothetical protein
VNATEEISDEVIEEALTASGFAWTRRQANWAVPARGSLPRELRVERLPDGLRVEALLVSWDEAGPAELEALACFLERAQRGLCFARCELAERQARLTAVVPAAEVETGLPDALAGVAAGARLLAREAAALLVPALARAYLQFNGADGNVGPSGP